MHAIRRSPFDGTMKNIPIIILIFMIVYIAIHLDVNNAELRRDNTTLKTTIKQQEHTIENMNLKETDLNEYIQQLEKENKQLATKVVELEQKKSTMSKKIMSTRSGMFKSYTDYKCLSRSSAQWQLQEQAYTDANGLRKIGDAYLVALGSYYGTTLGTKYTVTLSNGNSFQIILCDCKQDRHTDTKNQVCLSNGSILEFYVDTSRLPNAVRTSGSISSIDFFNGYVVNITNN